MSLVDHRSVIAGLSASERSELLGKSDRAGLTQLAGHLGLVTLTSLLILRGGRFTPLFLVMQGVLIAFLFTALHETVHRTPFRSRWINDLVGQLCGFLVLIGSKRFRYFHLEHHRYTNDPDRDPELVEPRPTTRSQYVAYLTGLPDHLGRLQALWSNGVGENNDTFVPADSRSAVRRQAQLQLFAYVVLIVVSVLLGTAVLVWLWLVPLLLGAPFLRAYLLAEHAGCPEHDSMLQNTRTVLTNPVVRFVAWNMPFHAEHHAFPAVPFHKLRRFNRHTQKHLGVVERGYLRFNRSYLNMFK